MKKIISILIAILNFAPGTIAVAAELAMVESLQVAPDAVVIRTDREVRYNAFTTGVPPRLIVELLDSKVKARETIPGAGKFLKTVRSAQYQNSPVSISRIVLDLAKKTAYDIVQKGSELEVSLRALPAPAPKADLKDAPVASPPVVPATKLPGEPEPVDAADVSAAVESEPAAATAAAAETAPKMLSEETKKPAPVIIPVKKKETVKADRAVRRNNGESSQGTHLH
ncbi:MAG: AMIN domain-containing protein [bacterium]